LGFDRTNIDAYNAELIEEAERVRDFIVLHYCLTQRDDAPLWNDCRAMALPDSLTERIEMYRRTGRIRPRAGELFTDSSWFYVFDGMGVVPEGCDPLTAIVPTAKLAEILAALAHGTAAVLDSAPPHANWFEAPTGQRCA
jgi:tryptophan halogenase